MKENIRVRFAPSPTGLMHVGGARTALFNYLFAKHHNGQFILRLEDTDRERFVEEGIEQIQYSLKWLGLIPDEGYWHNQHIGAHGPYIQSERLKQYQKLASELVEKGLAYYSRITLQDFDDRKQQAIKSKQPFVYRQAMEPSVEGDDSTTGKWPIRLKVSSGSTKWLDLVRGEFTIDNDLIDDFIILKADGFPTYNFANVVDDHLMQISHVIRGDEFIASTPKHALLYDYLGWHRPQWIHLPVINGADGKKLSKRNGDANLLDYQAKGYIPEAFLNYLALLGWNDGSEQEIFSRDELIKKFDINRIQKSPAIFDVQRLDWLNGRYIREFISEVEYLDQVRNQLKKSGIDIDQVDHDFFTRVAKLERERLKTFSEADELLDFFFIPPKITNELAKLACAKDSAEKIAHWLELSSKKLAECSPGIESIEQALRDLAQEIDIKTGQLFYPIRVAITGRTSAPGLFETIEALGLVESRHRIDRLVKKLQQF